jgi:hypothetical protein
MNRRFLVLFEHFFRDPFVFVYPYSAGGPQIGISKWYKTQKRHILSSHPDSRDSKSRNTCPIHDQEKHKTGLHRRRKSPLSILPKHSLPLLFSHFRTPLPQRIQISQTSLSSDRAFLIVSIDPTTCIPAPARRLIPLPHVSLHIPLTIHLLPLTYTLLAPIPRPPAQRMIGFRIAPASVLRHRIGGRRCNGG